MPDLNGVLSHRCACGSRLPATVFRGRGQLTGQCASCGRVLQQVRAGFAEGVCSDRWRPVSRQVVTNGCRGVAHCQGVIPVTGWSSDIFVAESERRAYARLKRELRSGRRLKQTTEFVPSAFTLQLGPERHRRLIYLYDPAGEVYREAGQLVTQRYLAYPSGIIFVADPFAITDVRADYAACLARDGERISPGSGS